jgi:hypothetical protein
MSNRATAVTQIIDTFLVPTSRVADYLSEEIGDRTEGRRIVALSVIPGATNDKGEAGVAVVLVTEEATP